MRPRALPTLLSLLLLLPVAAPGDEGVEVELLHQGDRTLELRISPRFGEPMRSELREWIEFTAGALTRVYGHWPRTRWQVSLHPVSAAGADPIPWAQVHRGETDRVDFHVAPRASAEQLKSEWTGYHELAHLLIPYRGWGDAWFSEGLASYYQNVLQARAGVIDEQGMWQRLYEGFMRGRADTLHAGLPLHEASERMHSEGGFMRVYWSGAWYFLKLDTRLRRQSGGRQSLDTALGKLNACCADQALSVPEIVTRLDETSRVVIFQPLYESTRERTEQPDFDTLFASLGITVRDGHVVLQDTGPGARLRRQIATPGAL